MTDAKTSPGTKRGDFFAIDRRAWARVCALDINAMVAYLVLARGTGPDQRTTSWSVKAIETYTGIGRPRARSAIEKLVRSQLVHVTQAGKRPRYRIVPAHEIPGSDGYPPPARNATEQKVIDYLGAGVTWLPPERHAKWDYERLRTVAADLVKKGWARDLGDNHFVAIPYDAEAAAKPDWIWLPNAVIDGAAKEVPPVELIRQTQNAAALRLFIDLYHAQALGSDGGIHWRIVRENFTRHTIGRRGAFVIYGFERTGQVSVFRHNPIIRPYIAGRAEVEPDEALKPFWKAWGQIVGLGLVELIRHLIDADTDTGDIIHACAFRNGETSEQGIALAAHLAAAVMLTEKQERWAASRMLQLAPIRVHMSEVQMVGIARLRYRPKTTATAAWYASMASLDEMAARYDKMFREAHPAAR